ncbi:hypothetical protein [Burkholderia ubonensis]|uniref:hypothetical protein n=1 Tax=Burkholderia ubonensis TaxID=101571 RepID=UPI001583F344|nr:hypothetical protein [Burkholderia ubonensis]
MDTTDARQPKWWQLEMREALSILKTPSALNSLLDAHVTIIGDKRMKKGKADA